ncbi:MAG: hypothetical protein RR222_23300 [Pseudomonas sp.]|uniref:hypothetical protein n=1 Tax=Pseudomonas sp. TaxID=306 RepID=UPI002FCA799D
MALPSRWQALWKRNGLVSASFDQLCDICSAAKPAMATKTDLGNFLRFCNISKVIEAVEKSTSECLALFSLLIKKMNRCYKSRHAATVTETLSCLYKFLLKRPNIPLKFLIAR